MSTIEMKYSLFKDIDSITDELMLHKLVALVRGMLAVSHREVTAMGNTEEIPDFIRSMSVSTGLSGDIDAKNLMHEHWSEAYG
jgi:hypothetical protein